MSEIINYTKEKLLKEEYKIEIEDTKNVFLKGRTPQKNEEIYFGIWKKSENGNEVTATIKSRDIKFDYSIYGSIGSIVEIRHFIEANNKIEKISKDKFFKKLDTVKAILKE